jgi:hypothetical protein
MSDFPRSKAAALPLFVSTHSHYGAGFENHLMSGGAVPAAVTWVANLVAYVPVAIPFAYPVNRVWWVNGSTITTTNVDFGIYTRGGALIYNTGSTAMAGISSVQYVTPSTKFLLAPNAYYFAWTCSSSSSNRGFASANTANGAKLAGLLQEAGSIPLPASMTPATWAQTFAVPLCGVTRTASGF